MFIQVILLLLLHMGSTSLVWDSETLRFSDANEHERVILCTYVSVILSYFSDKKEVCSLAMHLRYGAHH